MNLNKYHLNSDFIILPEFKITANRLYILYIDNNDQYCIYKLVNKDKYQLEESSGNLRINLNHDIIHRLYLSYRYNTSTPQLLYD